MSDRLAAAPGPALQSEQRRVSFWSVASGLAAAVPVPFLDDHLVRLSRRRLVSELAQRRGLMLTVAEVHHLSGTELRRGWGCLVAMLLSAVLKIFFKVLKRLFRTLFFWLTLKDASDAASKTFHEGFLLLHGLDCLATRPGLQDPEDPLDAKVRALRAGVERVTGEVDTRPMQKLIRSAFRSSRGVLRRAARVLARSETRRNDQERQAEILVSEMESEQGLAALASRLGSLFSTEGEYWADVLGRFQRAQAPQDPAPPPSHQPA